jgi:hypothetical protein
MAVRLPAFAAELQTCFGPAKAANPLAAASERRENAARKCGARMRRFLLWAQDKLS